MIETIRERGESQILDDTERDKKRGYLQFQDHMVPVQGRYIVHLLEFPDYRESHRRLDFDHAGFVSMPGMW